MTITRTLTAASNSNFTINSYNYFLSKALSLTTNA